MTNFSSPQQLKTLENSPNTPPNRLSLSKTPLRTGNRSEHPADTGHPGTSDQEVDEISGDFFNRIALNRSLVMSSLDQKWISARTTNGDLNRRLSPGAAETYHPKSSLADDTLEKRDGTRLLALASNSGDLNYLDWKSARLSSHPLQHRDRTLCY